MRYMNGDELAELMKSGKTPKKDFLVVDVRDDDYAGGNIKGAVNLPSREFLMNVDGLVKDTKQIPLIIFHCSLSQVRGPKAARIYSETRQNVLDGNDIDHEVVILRDGFSQFQVKYKDDPALIENWDKDVWASDWS
ncbi:Rhodanese-like protein [Agrocybe pediades]|nr:Rhodanese-like protein [Agrocybe pediades]